MKSYLSLTAKAGLAILALALACSCKGRTAENMVPSGDTVDVVISSPDITDTLARPDSLPTEAQHIAI